MVLQRSRLATLCFILLLIIGLGFLLIGLFAIPMLPYFQLDAVLTPADLADQSKKEATLAVLKRAGGNAWIFWSGGGLLVVCFSILGLWASLGNTQPTDRG